MKRIHSIDKPIKKPHSKIVKSNYPSEAGDNNISVFKRRNMSLNWQWSQDSKKAQLCFAARWNRTSMLKNILDKNPDLINKTEALHEACLNGSLDCVSILIEKYSENVNRKSLDSIGEYPLISAICSGNFKIVEYLLGHGASLNIRAGFCNESPIQCCQRNMRDLAFHTLVPEYIPIFKLLVDAGSNLNETHLLLKQSPVEFVKKLEGDPEHLKKIREILSQKTYSLDSFTEIMKELGDDIGFDDLIYAMGSISVSGEPTPRKNIG